MAIAIYTEVSTGRHHWAEATSKTTQEKLVAGTWVLFDATPDDQPPPGDPLDNAVSDLLATGSASKTSARLRAAFGLSIAATVSASGALALGKHTPVDATAAARTMTLPTGAADGVTIGVEKVDASLNAVSVTGNIRGVPATTITLAWSHETLTLRADATGSWWPVSGHKTKASLDAAFDAAGLFRGRRPQPPVNASLITTFAAGHGWAAFASTPPQTLGDDTTDYALGSQSLKATTKTDGSPAAVQKTGQAINATAKNLRLWVKIENLAQLTELILYVGDGTLTNYFQWTILDTGGDAQNIVKDGEWAAITLGFGSAATVGSPDRASLALTRLRLRGNNGQTITAHYGGLGLVNVLSAFPKGLVTFTCDDSYASQHNVMRPILDGKGWGASSYEIAGNVGTAGFKSLAQLHQAEQQNGWEICGHSTTVARHAAGLSTLPAADQDAELRDLRAWLISNGFRGADHYAYPLGFFSAATDAVVAKYFASARTIISRTRETARPANPLRIRSRSVTNTTTLATVQGEIDAAYANGGWYVLTVHDLQTTPTLGTHWATADFQAVVDYIAAKGDMPVLTMSDALARMAA